MRKIDTTYSKVVVKIHDWVHVNDAGSY